MILFKRNLIVLLVFFLLSACGDAMDKADEKKFLTFVSGHTVLNVPIEYLYKSDGWWSQGDDNIYDKDDSILLKLKNNRIGESEVSDSSNIILFIVYPADKQTLTDISIQLNENAEKINAENDVKRDKNTSLYRAYVDGVTFRWYLLNKLPPITADNIIASCVDREVLKERCRLTDFSPIDDIAVSLALNAENINDYGKIKERISKLIISWQASK